MTRTYRHKNKEKYPWLQPPKKWRIERNRSFRMKEKQYFSKFKEYLRKSKDHCFWTW